MTRFTHGIGGALKLLHLVSRVCGIPNDGNYQERDGGGIEDYVFFCFFFLEGDMDKESIEPIQNFEL